MTNVTTKQVTVLQAKALLEDPFLHVFFLDARVQYPEGAEQIASWLLGHVTGVLNTRNLQLQNTALMPTDFILVLKAVSEDRINTTAGRHIVNMLVDKEYSGKVTNLIEEMSQISNETELEAVVAEAIELNPKAAADIKSGKEQAMGVIIGCVMKQTKGRANPKSITKLVHKLLTYTTNEI